MVVDGGGGAGDDDENAMLWVAVAIAALVVVAIVVVVVIVILRKRRENGSSKTPAEPNPAAPLLNWSGSSDSLTLVDVEKWPLVKVLGSGSFGEVQLRSMDPRGKDESQFVAVKVPHRRIEHIDQFMKVRKDNKLELAF